MENIRKIQKLIGVDVGYHNSNIHPVDREGCIGKNGIDKSFTKLIIYIKYIILLHHCTF